MASEQVAAERLGEPLAVRALALSCGGVGWVVVNVDAALLTVECATAIRAAVQALGWQATVVASGQRSHPALPRATGGAWAAQVQELAAATAQQAMLRLSPATLQIAGATLDDEPVDGQETINRLPFVDLLLVSAGRDRPAIHLATAALPRLVDAFRGEVRRGPWRRAATIAAALLDEPVALVALPSSGVQEVDPQLQRSGREPRVASRLAAAVAAALSSRAEPVTPQLTVQEVTLELPTQPLPDRYEVRRAADRAEFGCEDGTLAKRSEATWRWQWLERLYQAAMEGRTATVPVLLQVVHLGAVKVVGLAADVSDSVAETLTERFGDEPVLFISGANGRAAPLLSQPSRATVGGGRELEPLTDLWPLASAATGLVLASLLELTNR
ncbi:MAG: hypothetical protein IT204_24525 [Fimbriimonadaceae bacterium]|nr:hypothetical protein [Fimbriimonadaceae bacterium]